MRFTITHWKFVSILIVCTLLLTPAKSSDQSFLSGQVKGRLLVAAPKMPDPRFRNTVILMLEHNKDGAFGLIINQPLGYAEFELKSKQEEKYKLPISKTFVFAGGPVEPEKSFIVHSTDYKNKGTVKVSDGVWMTADIGIIRAIKSGEGPKKILHVIGYSGWAPGQLETEIERNVWYTSPTTAELVFGKKHEGKWKKALEERYRDL